MFQSGNLLPALTALDQLRLVAHLARRSKDSATFLDPRQLLDDVGIAGKERRRPHELSGGERQRVGIARALIGRPSLLWSTNPPRPWTAPEVMRWWFGAYAAARDSVAGRTWAAVGDELVTHYRAVLGVGSNEPRVVDGVEPLAVSR